MAIRIAQSNTVHHTNAEHSSFLYKQRSLKRFYDRFQTEYCIFLTHIKGITGNTDLNRFASLMLTRLMFLYFIQHKGFLDNDACYLSNHLKMFQDRKNTQLNFYRDFLLILFQEGLSKPVHPAEHYILLGNIPFLNIALFKEHQLERDNSSTLQLPNEAFEQVFNFFDAYYWRLDAPPQPREDEITPDVLGYIFEKHINQKQMGAYYTQADITGYIAQTTIIPFLFDAVQQKAPLAFLAGGPVCRLLRDNPDRYIYPAVKKGVEFPLPCEITIGLNDVSRRIEWNKTAPGAFALPTETWREFIARRQRYQEIRAKLETGSIHCINDLITYNLDLRQLAQDIIENCEELDLLQAFYESLSNLSILDPTCGSGAFLFAALDILEPLYSACLERLELLESRIENSKCPDEDPPARPLRQADTWPIDQHPNPRYSILKYIISTNLYGVDIMEEVTEICKLRLFLKLLALFERTEDIGHLPNLDSNFRTGNALIGSVHQLDDTTCNGGASPARHPHPENQPFHWFSEFPRIMQNGGFDVIIGNPPYVEYEKVSRNYMLMSYTTLTTGNLYALTMERCANLLAPGGRFGMIVPASATCTDGYLPLQQLLLDQSALHISSFSDQRGKLFDIPHPRLCIITYQKGSGSKSVFSTSYLKPGRELRASLFQRLEFIEVTQQVKPGIIPRYGSLLEQTLHAKLHSQSHYLGDYLCKAGSYKLYYTRKLSWFVQVTPFIPCIIDEQGGIRNPSELKTLLFSSPEHADIAFVALNSNLFYWFLTTGSDCRNLNMREVLGLPLSIEKIPSPIRQDLRKLAARLAEELQAHSRLRNMHFKNTGTLTIQCVFPGKSKPIIDEIDHMLAQHYGFSEEEVDFIVNYDIKYRIGRDYNNRESATFRRRQRIL